MDKKDRSELGRALAALRKSKDYTFNDPETASKAGKAGAERRWRGHVKKTKSADTAPEAQSQPEA